MLWLLGMPDSGSGGKGGREVSTVDRIRDVRNFNGLGFSVRVVLRFAEWGVRGAPARSVAQAGDRSVCGLKMGPRFRGYDRGRGSRGEPRPKARAESRGTPRPTGAGESG